MLINTAYYVVFQKKYGVANTSMGARTEMGLSVIEEVAREFIDLFQMREKSIVNCTNSGTVSRQYFCSEDSKPGFLNDLIDCIEAQGVKIAQFVKPELTPNRKLPISDFAKGLSTMSMPELIKMQNFYQKMDSSYGRGEAYFPPEYGQISKYFATADKSNNDSAEAGRLLLMISSIGDELVKLKKDFQEYTPKTVDKFQETYLKAKTSSLGPRDLLASDRTRRAIDYMLKHLKSKVLSMDELKKMTSRLKRQKRAFLELIISFSQAVSEKTDDQISNSIRKMNAWLDWEVFVPKNEQEKLANESKDFAHQLSYFKNDMQNCIGVMEGLSSRIKLCVQKKEVIGGYFYLILKDVESFMQRVMNAKIHINPSLKVDLLRLSHLVKKTEIMYRRQLEREKKEISKYPELIRKRIEYFSYEIPEVLCRGKLNELKYMSLSVNASYDYIEKRLRHAFAKIEREELVDQVCDVIKRRYSNIVKNSTNLVRVVKKQAV